MIELFGEWNFATSPVVALLELVIMYLFFSRLAKPRIPEWELLLLGLTVLVVQPMLVAELSHMGLSVWKASGVGTFFCRLFCHGLAGLPNFTLEGGGIRRNPLHPACAGGGDCQRIFVQAAWGFF